MSNTYLGIDMGTSAMKLTLIDNQNRVLSHASVAYEASHPKTGWSEIDPEIWFDRMMEGLEEVLKEQDPSAVRAIGLTGQMHTLVLLDDNGSPVRPAIMWNDKRTKDMIPDLKERFASFQEGAYLSATVSTGSPAANLYWMALEEPENLKRVRHFLIGPDYLAYRLTGQYSTDYCEASTSCLYQLKGNRWSEEVRNLIGIDREIYPELYGSAQMTGTVLPMIADRIGISADTAVVAGTGDNPATAISTGCLGLKYPVLSLGTSGVLMIPVNSIEEVAKGKVILYSNDNREFSYLVQGVVQSTGESVDWWTRKVLGERSYEELTERFDPAGIRGLELIFYPHINGDKTIYADSELRGAFIGLSSFTTAEEMFFAVMEGLCFAFRELAENMKLPLDELRSLKAVGGGSNSPVWMQTMANVLGVTIEKAKGMVGPSFGSALLACGASEGIDKMNSLARKSLHVERTFEPDPELTGWYREKYQRYLRIHDAMKYVADGSVLTGTAEL